MCKPLHAGKAAQNGLFAAQMAMRGLTSCPNVLERPQGFAHTQSDQPSFEAGLQGLGTHWEVRDTLFKYHASCYQTHAMIEAIYSLQRADLNDVQAGTVNRIEVAVHTAVLESANILNPMTGLEGKFSLRHCAALVLTGKDTASPEHYTDESVINPELVVMRDKVVV